MVLTGALCACEEAEPVDEPVSADAGRPENPAPTSFTLRVQSSVAAAEGAPTGPIRLLIEDAAGERRDDLLLADVVERWPIEVNLDALPDGRFHFTVYQDRDADGAYDGCPFPPGPEHTEQADRFDNLVGVGEVLGQRRA
ncbi:MAG: hypothetical protein KC620_15445, partial [Myxococcales bacterium]|nr:hypothetical protein [Myxococcales bacterium]